MLQGFFLSTFVTFFLENKVLKLFLSLFLNELQLGSSDSLVISDERVRWHLEVSRKI